MTVNKDGQKVEEWLELANGCICCSVKDSGVAAIESLISRSGAFDYILLETTGLADPGNLAPLFWVDEGLGSSIYLDGVVTLVDAKNFIRSLHDKAWVGDGVAQPDAITRTAGDSIAVSGLQHQKENQDDICGKHFTTAHLQVSHADIIIVNKVDLVSESELDTVLGMIKRINALAKTITTNHSRVPQLEGSLLDIHAYDNVTGSEMEQVTQAKGHSHLDKTISTVSLRLSPLNEIQFQKLEWWLRSVCWESSLPLDGNISMDFEIHRIKGRILLESGQTMTLQGVREIFEVTENNNAGEHGINKGDGKIVIIGRGLEAGVWQQSIEQATRLTKT